MAWRSDLTVEKVLDVVAGGSADARMKVRRFIHQRVPSLPIRNDDCELTVATVLSIIHHNLPAEDRKAAFELLELEV